MSLCSRVAPHQVKLYHLGASQATEIDRFHCEEKVQACAAEMIERLIAELHIERDGSTIQVTERTIYILRGSLVDRSYDIEHQRLTRITRHYFQQIMS